MAQLGSELSTHLSREGTGEIKDGKPHIHCILGLEGDASLPGHLHWARVENWFVNVYIAEMG